MRQQKHIEIAVLLALREEADGAGAILLPSEVAARFTPAITEIAAGNSLQHLDQLGLVQWRLKSGRQAYHVTRDGARLVDDNFAKQADDDSWIVRNTLALDLDALVANRDDRRPEPIDDTKQDAVAVGGTVIFQNNYNPSRAQSQSQFVNLGSDPNSKSATRAGWVNVWVAVIVGVIATVVALWAGGAF